MALIEANRREDSDTRMLLLANEKFDKETGGYKNESEEAEELISEKELSPIRSASKKAKASTELQSSKEKKAKGDEQASTRKNEAEKSWTILKRDSGWNKYADNGFVVHLKGSKLGPTLELLRSTKKKWLE